MILGMTFYQIVWNFLIYSVVGWCVEVIFHALTFHKVINRGFLNGPVCPVYGFGVVVVFGVINVVAGLVGGRSFGEAIIKGGTGLPPGKDINIFLLFIIGVVFCTIVELIGGILLDVVYHTRWWDYSDEFLNFRGYICLKFSLLWGVGIVIVVKLVQPLLLGKATELIPESIGWWIAGFFLLIYLIDLIVSALTMFKLNRELKELDSIQKGMRTVSNKLSYFLGETAFVAEEFSGKGNAQEMTQQDTHILETRDEFESTHSKELEKAKEMREKYDNSWLGKGGQAVAGFFKNTGEAAKKAANSIADGAKSVANAIATGAKGAMDFVTGKDREKEIAALAAEAESLERRRENFDKKFAKWPHLALSRLSRAGEDFKSTRYQESLDKLQNHLYEVKGEKKK